MWRYLLKRLAFSILVVIGVTVLAFAAVRFLPGDAVNFLLGLQGNPEVADALRHRLGLDQPVLVSYLSWMSRVLRGDLGESLIRREPVMDALRQRIPVTLELTLLATLIAVVIALPAGIIAALRRSSLGDYICTTLSLISLSVPGFWLATLLILLFSVKLQLVPPGGLWVGPFEDLGANLKRIFMPALAIGLPSAGIYFRITRSSMLEVLHADYMVTARSKGISEKWIVLRHALKNAFVPIVTVSASILINLLGGSIIIEEMFSLPGIGRATIRAIHSRDYILLQGLMMAYALTVVGISLALDVMYTWLDPRIHHE